MESYRAFAECYDALMDDFDYDVWSDYYLRLLARQGCRPHELCDCACGTGSLSIRFAECGIKVIGADLSADMLEVAAQKARKAGVFIPFIQQDMRALKLTHRTDAIVCGCDGVNYLCDLASVKRFFTAAHGALKPGGVLAFDISSAYKLERVIGEGFFGEERDDIAYLWQNSFSTVTRKVTMDLTFFRRLPNGLYERFAETHVQRAHTRDEIEAALRECGFADIVCFADQTFDLPKEDTLRLHFCARKA